MSRVLAVFTGPFDPEIPGFAGDARVDPVEIDEAQLASGHWAAVEKPQLPPAPPALARSSAGGTDEGAGS